MSFRGRWLVGFDGGRSITRKTAGSEFVGKEATFTGYPILCDFDHPEKFENGVQHNSERTVHSIAGQRTNQRL